MTALSQDVSKAGQDIVVFSSSISLFIGETEACPEWDRIAWATLTKTWNDLHLASTVDLSSLFRIIVVVLVKLEIVVLAE